MGAAGEAKPESSTFRDGLLEPRRDRCSRIVCGTEKDRRLRTASWKRQAGTSGTEEADVLDLLEPENPGARKQPAKSGLGRTESPGSETGKGPNEAAGRTRDKALVPPGRPRTEDRPRPARRDAKRKSRKKTLDRKNIPDPRKNGPGSIDESLLFGNAALPITLQLIWIIRCPQQKHNKESASRQ